MNKHNLETLKQCVDLCKEVECEKSLFKNGFCEDCYNTNNKNMVQSVLIINFESSVSSDKRQEIINNFYINNEKQIYGMNVTELKKGLNKSKEVRDLLEKSK